jgi:hypothetical protein
MHTAEKEQEKERRPAGAIRGSQQHQQTITIDDT